MGYIVYEFNRMQMFGIIYIKYKHLLNETDKGVQFEIGDKQPWLPKSMVAVDFKNKVIATPSTIAFRADILDQRIEPKQKIDELALRAIQNKTRERTRRPFRDKTGKHAV